MHESNKKDIHQRRRIGFPNDSIGFSERYDSLVLYTTTDRAICPGSKGLFVPVLEPGQGRRDKSAGVFCPGW